MPTKTVSAHAHTQTSLPAIMWSCTLCCSEVLGIASDVQYNAAVPQGCDTSQVSGISTLCMQCTVCIHVRVHVHVQQCICIWVHGGEGIAYYDFVWDDIHVSDSHVFMHESDTFTCTCTVYAISLIVIYHRYCPKYMYVYYYDSLL